jgi:uncharacterized membrane protein YeaQ/YmgE (transglycosylase-associated protein family)
MGIVTWIIFGLLAGIIAKFIMPGKDPGGFVFTILIGIAGAVVGGFVGTLLGLGDVSGFNIGSFLIAVGGAILLLAAYRFIAKR